MKSIKNNVIFTTSERQMIRLSNRYWGVFEWIRFFHLKTKVNIFNSKNTLFDFDKEESRKTKSKQLIEFTENKDDYERYALNILDHSSISIWISKYSYNGISEYYNWDGGEIAYIFVKKDWKYKDEFIKLLNKSCSLWTQYNEGYFNWIMDLSDDDIKSEYKERIQDQENHNCNCSNCSFNLSVVEMRDKINSWEIEYYEPDADKFGLEYIKEELFGVNDV